MSLVIDRDDEDMPHKRPRILDQGFCFAKLYYSSHPISYHQDNCIIYNLILRIEILFLITIFPYLINIALTNISLIIGKRIHGKINRISSLPKSQHVNYFCVRILFTLLG